VTATSTGGRDGTISSTPTDETAPLNLKLTPPRVLGGSGDRGHNPEQLFAAGYSGKSNQFRHLYINIGMNINMACDPIEKKTACFLSAVQVAATKLGKREVGARAVIHADVTLGRPTDRPGFGLKVLLRVEGVEDQAILDAAHEVSCTLVTTTGTDVLFVNRCAHTAAL
jgi:organic hydroperoxide reductase OsmC/OhrA